MKIIKVGSLPEEKIYKETCAHCKTIFEFVRKEAKSSFDQRDGDYLSIACPVCLRICTVNV